MLAGRAGRLPGRSGAARPLHLQRKVLLAHLTPDELVRIYPDKELPALTARSITDWAALTRELRRIRKAGYATNREEAERGVASVAAAAPSQGSSPRFALNVAAPVPRLPMARMREFGRALEEAAEELRGLLG